MHTDIQTGRHTRSLPDTNNKETCYYRRRQSWILTTVSLCFYLFLNVISKKICKLSIQSNGHLTKDPILGWHDHIRTWVSFHEHSSGGGRTILCPLDHTQSACRFRATSQLPGWPHATQAHTRLTLLLCATKTLRGFCLNSHLCGKCGRHSTHLKTAELL